MAIRIALLLLLPLTIGADEFDNKIVQVKEKIERLQVERDVYRSLAEQAGYVAHFYKENGMWYTTIRYKGEIRLDHQRIYK